MSTINTREDFFGLPASTRTRRHPSDTDQAAEWYQTASAQFAAHLSRLSSHLLEDEDAADLLPLLHSVATSAIKVGRMGVVSGWDPGPEWLQQGEGEGKSGHATAPTAA